MDVTLNGEILSDMVPVFETYSGNRLRFRVPGKADSEDEAIDWLYDSDANPVQVLVNEYVR